MKDRNPGRAKRKRSHVETQARAEGAAPPATQPESASVNWEFVEWVLDEIIKGNGTFAAVSPKHAAVVNDGDGLDGKILNPCAAPARVAEKGGAR